MFHDLSQAFRSFRRAPGFAAAVVATFALGVGATTAVFVTLDQFLMQGPAGVVSPGTLKRVHQRFLIPMTREARTRSAFSWVELRALASELSDASVAGFIGATRSGGAGSQRREMRTTYVAGDYFGLLGVGTFSNVAYIVSQRVHEIGIRRSLGAGHGAIVSAVLTSTGRLVLLGVVIGTGAAIGLARFLRVLVYDISPIDPLSLGIAVGVLLLGGLAACLLPLRAALKVDPMVVLASE